MQPSPCAVQRICRACLMAVLITFVFCINVRGHSGSVYPGDINKQRLLLHATSQYVYTISQGQIDMDSAVRIVCDIYNLSPFLLHSEGYSEGNPTPGTRLLEQGNVTEAMALLSRTKGETRIQLLLDLAGYFLFKSGSSKPDLDEAQVFIQKAFLEIDILKSSTWKIEALRLQAFYLGQSGRGEESVNVIQQAITLAEESGNKKQLAQTQLDAARLLPFGHPARMANLEKALSLFQSLKAHEKEIETLGEMTVEYFVTKRHDKANELLNRNLERHEAIGYEHSQYVHDVLAYLADKRSEYTLAISYSNKSLACMRTKEDSTLAPFFYSRRASIYMHVYKFEDALEWSDMALTNKTHRTRLFWYKAFLTKALVGNYLQMSQEVLALITEVEKDFPPASLFEQMYLHMSKGEAYDNLNEFKLAETHYNAFLNLSEQFPPAFINSEFPQALTIIARFYCEINKTDEARALLAKVKSHAFEEPLAKASYYSAMFKVDSTEKKYFDAITNFQLFRLYSDTASNLEQRKKAEELFVQYETEKKDKDILLLKQQGELQQARLDQSHFARNISFAGAALLLLIAGLLYYLYHTKQQSNTQLTHLLNEKEWLLKEIHHRVKNNLQTVLSLLESQSRKLSNEALDAIHESQNRVYAMSLIHKKLYQSTDVSSINMEDYLRDLVQHLRDSFGSSGGIRFSMDLDNIELDVSQAVPLGLIVNEAVTNSIKYAFPHRLHDNEIDVSLKNGHGNSVQLLIKDNGVGIDSMKVDSLSLGLKLMRGLTEDIDGSFSIESNESYHGVSIHISFIANVPFQKVSETKLPQRDKAHVETKNYAEL